VQNLKYYLLSLNLELFSLILLILADLSVKVHDCYFTNFSNDVKHHLALFIKDCFFNTKIEVEKRLS